MEIGALGKLIIGAIVTFVGGVAMTALISSLTFWRDFELAQERLNMARQVIQRQDAAITTLQAANVEQQYSINLLLERMRLLERGRQHHEAP